MKTVKVNDGVREFLNETSASMRACTESVIAYDLGIPYDQDTKESEYETKRTFGKFFKFFGSAFDLTLLDIIDDIDYAITTFKQDGVYWICSNKFTLKTVSSDVSEKEMWEAIYLSCKMYMGLDVEIDSIKYIYEQEK